MSSDPRPSSEVQASAKAPITRAPLFILATVAICGVLYFASGILIPVALSLYAAILLYPAVDLLCRLRLPRMAAAAFVMLVLAASLAAIVDATLEPARAWVERAPRMLQDIERKLHTLRRAATQFEKVAAHAERITGTPATASAAPAAAPASVGWLHKAVGLLVPLVGAFFLTLFMLACGPPVLKRLADGRANTATGRQLLATTERARREMGRYLGTITLINLGLGTATAILAAGFDLPNPLLWGVMAGVFNYIPYAGSAVTLCVLTVVALLTHDSIGPALGIAASYLALDTIEGQFVQPLAIGRRLALNPLAVFLALWIGAGLWGIAGMLLATPVLLTTKIICRQMPRCRAFSDFLAPIYDPPIALRARKWQRHRYRHQRAQGHGPRKPRRSVPAQT